jgi:hypothetical protein
MHNASRCQHYHQWEMLDTSLPATSAAFGI